MVMIYYSLEFATFGQRVQSVIGLSFMAIYFVIPVIALVGFLSRFKEIRTRSMKSRFGAFYQTLAVKKGR